MKVVACCWISGVDASKKKKKQQELAGEDAKVVTQRGEVPGSNREETLQNERRFSSGECSVMVSTTLVSLHVLRKKKKNSVEQHLNSKAAEARKVVLLAFISRKTTGNSVTQHGKVFFVASMPMRRSSAASQRIKNRRI